MCDMASIFVWCDTSIFQYLRMSKGTWFHYSKLIQLLPFYYFDTMVHFHMMLLAMELVADEPWEERVWVLHWREANVWVLRSIVCFIRLRGSRLVRIRPMDRCNGAGSLSSKPLSLFQRWTTTHRRPQLWCYLLHVRQWDIGEDVLASILSEPCCPS